MIASGVVRRILVRNNVFSSEAIVGEPDRASKGGWVGVVVGVGGEGGGCGRKGVREEGRKGVRECKGG